MKTAAGKTTVIKIGGSLLEKKDFPRLALSLRKYLTKNSTLLVHGGGKEVTSFCGQLGIKSRFIHGKRFTDKKTMEAVEIILSGKINPELVSRLRFLHVPAVGLSGRVAGAVRARQIPSMGLVGKPVEVRKDFIFSLLRLGLVPVFSSVASDGRGNVLNVNADDMASALAAGIKADRLIFFTDVPGVLGKDGRTIPFISPAIARKLISEKVIEGGMIPKIESALNALKKGVKEIWILQGTLPLNRARGSIISKKFSSVRNPFL